MSSSVVTPWPEFSCGEWTVQPELNRIVRGDASVHLQPRLMDVLVFLAGRPGRVVTKAELVDALWPEEYVADAVLNRALCDLRRLLGDDAGSPRFIETIPKRGYRLVAEVGGGANRGVEVGRRVSEPHDEPWPHLLGPQVRGYLVWGGDEIPLVLGDHVLGRAQEADLLIRHPKISRSHALVRVTERGVSIEDLGSTNGTFVRGGRVQGLVPLSDGDEVALGPVRVVFRDAGDRTTRI